MQLQSSMDAGLQAFLEVHRAMKLKDRFKASRSSDDCLK